jgi:uncharacterized protein YceH (UPF0502 family)
MEREGGPVVARLPRKPGRKDHEYTHLFAGEINSVAEETDVAERSSAIIQKDARIDQLESRVNRLELALSDLAERLGEEISLPSK